MTAVGGTCLALMLAATPLAAMEPSSLADSVASGALPPLAQRLPEEPEIVKPIDGIGKYGGELRFGLRGSSDHNHILRIVGPQGLVRWNMTYTEIVPNVAKSFEVDETGKEFTFSLRKGMKWSDGQPFTADDIIFNVNDLLMNAEFAPTPQRYMSGGKPMKVEKVDDYTVKFIFAEP
jgi:peptide/nickel transport system substrate-binding protein